MKLLPVILSVGCLLVAVSLSIVFAHHGDDDASAGPFELAEAAVW